MSVKKVYSCSKCGAQFPKWSGRCLECQGWGTIAEDIVDSRDEKKQVSGQLAPAQIINLAQTKNLDIKRYKTGFAEADRVLGGGVVPGSMILIGGEPGIGKSTIIAQIANNLGKDNKKIIYASGEESAPQVKDRLERLHCDLKNILFISETNTEKIINAAKKEKPALLIIDSIQTVYSSDTPSEAGSVAQIRASAVKFLELAKENNIAVLLIGHITKDGQIAGPKTLEHIVDTVVYLEAEEKHNYRILRVSKNRFGSVNELGIFAMTQAGFEEIKNPSAIFVETSATSISGSVLSAIMEGSRPFLVDIQSLVSQTTFGYPQRKSSGLDLNRLQVLAAVLTKRSKLDLSNQDIILNIVGGLKVNDPGIDLAICLAIASSFKDTMIDRKTIVLGEVGLGGEVRTVAKLEQRLKEAQRLGFEKAITPETTTRVSGLEIKQVKNIGELLK